MLVADDKTAALELLEARQPDLVVCDVNGDTLGLLDAVRQSDGLASVIPPDTPLIVLTAQADAFARVRYFERGSDDVVTKPFSYPELRARIRALLHRTYDRPTQRRIRVGALTIDRRGRQARVADTTVELSKMEFALLAHLAGEPTRVWTKEELLCEVWGFRSIGRTRTVDSHACRLRNKLAGAGGRYVDNLWGVGYRLVAVDPNAAGRSAA